MDRISSSKRRYCRIAFFRRDIAKRRKPAMHAIDPLYSVCGFVGGLLVGMTGVGGGSLMTPLLILLFGVHPATAVGTDLLFAAATKTGGSLVQEPEPVAAAPDSPGRDDAGQAHFLSVPMLLAVAG